MSATLLKMPMADRCKHAASATAHDAETCALCGGRFWIERNRIAAFPGRDNRLYCSPEHADFGLDAMLEALVRLPRRVA